MIDAAQRQHLRAVFAGGDVADRFALGPHRVLLGPQVAVGVDLDLDAAVAVDRLADDGDHVDALDLGRDDKGRGLVIGIGRAGADGGDEFILAGDDIAVPIAIVFKEFNQVSLAVQGVFDDQQRIDAHQVAVFVGVAVAGPGPAFGDITQHRAGVAADFFGFGHVIFPRPPGWPGAPVQVSPANAGHGRQWRA